GGNSSVGKYDLYLGDEVYRLSTSNIFELRNFNQAHRDEAFDFSRFDFVLSHEAGHALGLGHARGWDCANGVLSGGCGSVEYGNSFDAMGNGYYALHFNVFEKLLLGWLNEEDLVTITTPGTYHLSPLESTQGTRGAKIDFGGNWKPLFLEYRSGAGFDFLLNNGEPTSNLQGLLANQVVTTGVVVPVSRLLDFTPQPSVSWYLDSIQSSLNLEAEPFVDAGSGLTIGPVLTASPRSGATFAVDFAPSTCIEMAPSLQLSGTPYVASGGMAYVSLTVTNEDSATCAVSDFNYEVVLPEEWVPLYHDPEDFSLAPQETRLITFAYQVPANLATGFYQIVARLTNESSDLTVEKTKNISVILPPVLESFEPAAARVGETVTVFGDHFSPYNPGNYLLFKIGEGPTDELSFLLNFPPMTEDHFDFVVPEEVFASTCGCYLPPPVGEYRVLMEASGADSNSLNFEILP
ncbi:MAG: hypothetical protein AAB589_03180, partial [Patescibacteria group bacterium]